MASSENHDRPEDAEASAAARAQRLMAEAKAAAFEHTRAVDQALQGVIALAREIAQGGDAYPAAVRDFCERMAEETDARRRLLDSLAARGLDPAGPPRFGLEGA